MYLFWILKTGFYGVLHKSLDPNIVSLLHKAFTVSKSSREVSYNISLKHNFEWNYSHWIIPNIMMSEKPKCQGRVQSGFSQHHWDSVSQRHCYSETKNKICTSSIGICQVKMNEILLSVMHPYFLWHHCRVDRSVPFSIAFCNAITTETMRRVEFEGHIIKLWKSASSWCFQRIWLPSAFKDLFHS